MTRDRSAGGGDEGFLRDVLDRLRRAERDGAVTVGEALSALEDRSLGLVIAGLGLIAAFPLTGALPGVPAAIAALVLAVVGRSVVGGERRLRVPGFIRRRSVDAARFERAAARLRPWAAWVDRRLRWRLTPLVASAAARSAILALCALLALSMLPLGLVPWGVTAPALALIAFGLALAARDGLMAAAGYALTAAAGLAAAQLL